jgi:hypothetical protein
MANQIKCDLNMNNNIRAGIPRHPLSSSKGILNKGISLFGYILEIEKEPGVFKELTEIFYFTEKLNASMIDAQFIRYSGMSKQTKGNRIFIVLSYKNENINSVVPYDIITTDANKHNFIEDIYESIKKYNKKEHNIIIRDDNKIISDCNILYIFLHKILNYIKIDDNSSDIINYQDELNELVGFKILNTFEFNSEEKTELFKIIINHINPLAINNFIKKNTSSSTLNYPLIIHSMILDELEITFMLLNNLLKNGLIKKNITSGETSKISMIYLL